MTAYVDLGAFAEEVVHLLSTMGVTARSTSTTRHAAQLDLPGRDDWVFVLTTRGWSTVYSRDGVDGEPVYGFVDLVPPDASPSVAAQAIRRQLADDALAGDRVRYLRRCLPG